MKRKMLFLLALTAMLTMVLAGCGGSSEKKALVGTLMKAV